MRKILRLNLSDRITGVQEIDETTAHRYIGGSNMAKRIFQGLLESI